MATSHIIVGIWRCLTNNTFFNFLASFKNHLKSSSCTWFSSNLISQLFRSNSQEATLATNASQNFIDMCDIAGMVNRLSKIDMSKMAGTVTIITAACFTKVISIHSSHFRIMNSIVSGLFSSNVKSLLVINFSY